jgi:hypothetical protein
MKKYRVIVPALLCCVLCAVLLTSCGSSECVGEIMAGGKTYTSKAKNEADAKRFACNKYCLDTYPKCKAMYDIWVNSPKGKAAGSPPMMRALSEDKQLLDCVTIECADKCLAAVGAGKIKVQVNCSK